MLGRYVNSQTPVRLRCATGHECRPRPSAVLSGDGICRTCAGKVWDVFYIVADPAAHRVKFGITSGDPRPRLRTHRRGGYQGVVRLLTDLPGTTAPDMEDAVQAALALAGLRPVLRREYYDISALPVVLDVVDNWALAPEAATAA
jgi:hypothetical protein